VVKLQDMQQQMLFKWVFTFLFMMTTCEHFHFSLDFGIWRSVFFVQALPLVSTFWGVVLFGEYRKSSKRTYTLLGSMLLMFIAAVAVLMASSGHRKWSWCLKENVHKVLNVLKKMV
jgi:glucose uptake protein GlcU